MSLKLRILVCLATSLPLTLIALVLDRGSLSIGLLRLSLVLIFGLLAYAPVLYVSFLSGTQSWTRITVTRFLKSLGCGLGVVLLGPLGLWFNARATNVTLTIDWFGFFWVLILFSGILFDGFFKETTPISAA